MRRHRALLTAFLLIGLAACGETTTPTGLPQGSYSRIVTLAPNLTELVFWAGAGERLVGVSAYSNHPPAALDLPVVGDAFMIDQERLAVLEPDLLLVWEGGTPAHVIDELGALGYRVEAMRTNSVADVARTIVRIGELTDHRETANRAAAAFEQRLGEIEAVHRDRADITVFYQVSARPLYTVNGGHFVSEIIELCGGTNVFGDLGELAPTIEVEAVVERDPEVFNRLEEKTAYLHKGLEGALQKSGLPYQINRFGSMISVHFTDDPVRDFDSAAKGNNLEFKKYFHGMLDRGVYLPPSAFESYFLNDALSYEDLDKAIDAATETLAN